MNLIRLLAVKGSEDPFAQELESLYLSAFPASERKAVSDIYNHANHGTSDVFVVLNTNDQFIGLAITLKGHQTVLIEYLAINPVARNHQYGSRLLDALSEHYATYTLCLEIEQVDDRAEPHDLKRRRKHFYERNGYYFLDKSLQYFGVPLELMATNQVVDKEDYYRAYQLNYGPAIQENVYFVEDIKNKEGNG